MFAARREIGVQQPEIRHSSRIRDHGFAIQDRVLRQQVGERIGDRLEARRPVVPRPRVDGRPPIALRLADAPANAK
jgi:hypothetical protein